MQIISSYIVKKVLVLTIGIMLISAGLSWMVEMLGKLNFLTASGQNLETIFIFSLLFLPSLVLQVLPFALAIALCQTFSNLQENKELLAINAAGFTPFRLRLPLIILAALFSLCLFFTQNYLAPYARLEMRKLAASMQTNLITSFVEQGSFYELTDNLFINVGQRLKDGTLKQLFIADQRSANTAIHYYADTAHFVQMPLGPFLVLEKGEMEQYDLQTGSNSLVKFSRYSLDLADLTPAQTGYASLYPKDLTLQQLQEHIQNKAFAPQINAYRAEIHRRFSTCLYPLIFTLISLFFTSRLQPPRQKNRFYFMPLLLCFLVYWVGYFLFQKAQMHAAYLPTLYLFPAALLCLFLFLLRGLDSKKRRLFKKAGE